MKSGIYKIINIITGDIYIGSSINLKERQRRHSKDLRRNQHHAVYLQRAVNKYGISNFKFIIIEYCEQEQLLIREQHYLDTLLPVYNTAKIAGSVLGVKQSEEAKEKKRTYALVMNVRPPESTWLEKQQQVYKLDMYTLEMIQGYDSLSEACRSVGKDATFASTISSCCRNKRYSAFGYRWVYKLEDIPNLRELNIKEPWNKGKTVEGKPAIPIIQYDLKGNFIKEWKSVRAAEAIYGFGIGNCARGKSKTSHNFKWKYKEQL